MLPHEANARQLRDELSNLQLELDRALLGHRAGATLEWSDATTITVKAGTIWFWHGTRINTEDHDIDLSAAADRESGVSEANNTCYYIYARPKQSSEHGWKAFFSTTQPTMKGGGRHPSNDWVYLGAVFNNSGGNIQDFNQCGRTFLFDNIPTWLNVGVHAKTQRTWGHVPANFFGIMHIYIISGGAAYIYNGPNGGLGGFVVGTYDNAQFTVRLDSNQKIYTSIATAGTGTYYTAGWIDPFLP